MPNHCYQSVYLAGDPKEIDRLYEAVKEEKFLNAVIPEPRNMFHGALGEEERKMCEAQGRPNWYDWRNENWLTKWDICQAEIIEEPQEIDHYPMPTKCFTFRCWTAWSPPIPVWDRLHEMGFDISTDYQDEGGMFEGEYQNGEDKCWRPVEEDRYA
jgi:hypothetical protein